MPDGVYEDDEYLEATELLDDVVSLFKGLGFTRAEIESELARALVVADGA